MLISMVLSRFGEKEREKRAAAFDKWLPHVMHANNFGMPSPLIVGLNVATKGALPFSRGKRVVPGKRDVPFRPFLTSKKQY